MKIFQSLLMDISMSIAKQNVMNAALFSKNPLELASVRNLQKYFLVGPQNALEKCV